MRNGITTIYNKSCNGHVSALNATFQRCLNCIKICSDKVEIHYMSSLYSILQVEHTCISPIHLHISGNKLMTPHINDKNTFQKACATGTRVQMLTVSVGSNRHLNYVQPWQKQIEKRNTGLNKHLTDNGFIIKLHQTTFQDWFHCENTKPFLVLSPKSFWHSTFTI